MCNVKDYLYNIHVVLRLQKSQITQLVDIYQMAVLSHSSAEPAVLVTQCTHGRREILLDTGLLSVTAIAVLTLLEPVENTGVK